MVFADGFCCAVPPKCGSRWTLQTIRGLNVPLEPKRPNWAIQNPLPRQDEGLPGFTIARPVGDWLVSVWSDTFGKADTDIGNAVLDYVDSHKDSLRGLLEDYLENEIGMVSEFFGEFNHLTRLDLRNISEDLTQFFNNAGVPLLNEIEHIPYGRNTKADQRREEFHTLVEEINALENLL